MHGGFFHFKNCSLGILGTGLAVQVDLWLVTITIGLGNGLSLCLAYAQTSEIVMKVPTIVPNLKADHS